MNEISGWWTGQRSGRWAVGLAQDVRQANVLVKWPAFACVGVTTLALCSAANVSLRRHPVALIAVVTLGLGLVGNR